MRDPRRATVFGCALVAFGALSLAPAGETGRSERPRSSLVEHVDVNRVVLQVRAVDRFGMPIGGLGAADFVVRIAGAPARVEAADWVEGRQDDDLGETTERARDEREAVIAERDAGGRFVVLLFQRDLHPSRIVGLMRTVPAAEEIVDALLPEDRVAILTMGSHLEIVTDFTADHPRALELLRDSIVHRREPPPPEAGASKMLSTVIDEETARATAYPEDALLLLGQALAPLRGSKSVVFFCWGMGFRSGGAVTPRESFGTALASLQAADVTVFSLDVTQADFHSLEGPLVAVARHTGGFYAKTHVFPRRAVERVAHALGGYYLLTVERPPDLEDGYHRLDVRLRSHDGTVYRPEFVELGRGR